MKAGDDRRGQSASFEALHGSLDPMGRAKQEFNKNRKIIITTAPLMNQDEAKEFLAGFECRNITVNKKLRQVVATLKDAAVADEAVAKLNQKIFRGSAANVWIYPSNKLLCVAQLPSQMSEKAFHELVATYGEVERCFLMTTETGSSKGYGFVEFACDQQESEVIRCKLERKSVSNSVLHCDFMKETITDFDQLNSSCLYVGNLPSDFGDDGHLRELFSVFTDPVFCRVARKDDKPVGFAIVEFTRPEQAEETFSKVQGRLIGGQMIDIKYCIPGHMAPEAFNRHLRFLDSSDGVEIVPKVLPVANVHLICHPPPVCSVLVNLLEKYPSVLKDFKQILLHLQKHLNQEQRQLMSDKPGLLGEAPNLNSPLNNAGIQFSLLAVMLGHQLQQSMPNAMSNSAILGMLPPGFNIQLMCASSGITQAMILIQATCKDDDDDDDDEEEDGGENDKNEEGNDNVRKVSEDLKTRENQEKSCGETEKPPVAPEPEIRPLMSVEPSVMSTADLLTDLDALLAFIQKNHTSKLKHPFAIPKNTAKTSEAGSQPAGEESTTEPPTSLLGEAPGLKAGLLGAPPSLLSQPTTLDVTMVSPLLGSTIEKLIQRHIFMGPTKSVQSPMATISSSGGSQSVVSLMDVPVAQPLLGNAPLLGNPVLPVNKGDGLMGPRPSVPIGLMNMKVGLERSGAGILGDGIMGSAPGGAGLLGSGPLGSDGLMGSGPWDLMEKKNQQMQALANISSPAAGGFGGGGGIGFGGGGGGFGSGSVNTSGVDRLGGGGSGVGGNLGFGSGSANEERLSGGGGKIAGSGGSGGSKGGVGSLGSGRGSGIVGEFGRGVGTGRYNQGSGIGWEGPNSVSWKSREEASWTGNNHGGGREGGRNWGVNSWGGGRSQGTDQRNWEGGMQNPRWDNQRDYPEWNAEHGGTAWSGGGGSGWNESGGNRGSWSGLQQSSQGFTQGQKQDPPPPLMGESPLSFGTQAGNQSYDSYYTDNKGPEWSDQYKGFGGNEQSYYGGNWSGMGGNTNQPSGVGQSLGTSMTTDFGKNIGQPSSQRGSAGSETVPGYGSANNQSNAGGNRTIGEAGYKADGTTGGAGGTFSYGSSVSGNSGNLSSGGAGALSSTSGGWDQNMYNQYMQQYMQQYGNYPSTTANTGATAGVSASASTGYGMEPYSGASSAASGQQASSAFSGQGQYGTGQGNFNQGQYGQTQGQYGQNQSQYGQNQTQYDQDPGQYGQSQGQYGLGQGQYGLSQGQYGQDYSSMKRPYAEELSNYQYSQTYGTAAKKSRP